MKKFVAAFATAILLAGQLLTPVAAASSNSVTAEDCGDTYVVQPKDSLSKIAAYCSTTVSSILALNSQIVNANLIYRGQVLRLTSNGVISSTTTTDTTYTSYAFNGDARVGLSTTRAQAGDDVAVTVSGFPANADIDYRVGVSGNTYSVAYDGKADSNGKDSQTITIPTNAGSGDYWVVQVITTGDPKVVSVISHTILIGTTSYTTDTGNAGVSLSTTSTGAGDTVTVSVSGFPKNAEIDYRLGKQGSNYSVVYDGTINSSGNDSHTITIPSSATVGDYWVVQVLTTSQKTVISVNSHTIHITD